MSLSTNSPSNRSPAGRRATVALLVGLCVAVLWPSASGAATTDPFYQRLFQDGSLALSRGDHAGAARLLRLACFGMLDMPEPLAVCLARLTVAQRQLDDQEAVLDTLGRVLEVERRFQVYAAVELSAPVRRELEETIEAWATPETLSDLPAFRHIAARQRRAATRDATASEIGGDGAAPEEPAPAKVVRGEPVETATPAGGPSETEEGVLAQNRQILVAGARDRFGDAFDSVRSLAERHPEWIEAQLVAAELAYRLSRWSESVVYFERAEESLAERPELQFYLAVALFKSGDVEAARATLDRCLPRIASSEYVDYWVERIRGGS